MKSISKTFLAGLATILPIVATFYLLFWLATSAESVLGPFLRIVLPDRVYRPGMGVGAGLILIFLVGLLMHAWIVRKVFAWGEALLYRMPIVKSVYGSIRDLSHFLSASGEREKDRRQVVMVTLGDSGAQVMGFVTRKEFSEFPEGIAGKDSVAVYIPMSYQIGGHTLVVSRSAVRSVDMSIREAMQFILTAGMTNGGTRSHRPSKP